MTTATAKFEDNFWVSIQWHVQYVWYGFAYTCTCMYMYGQWSLCVYIWPFIGLLSTSSNCYKYIHMYNKHTCTCLGSSNVHVNWLIHIGQPEREGKREREKERQTPRGHVFETLMILYKCTLQLSSLHHTPALLSTDPISLVVIQYY